jgi:hypothetical protein
MRSHPQKSLDLHRAGGWKEVAVALRNSYAQLLGSSA